ncbi:MAG: HAD family hydrolase [Betaproteobacteria bacterium]|nr:HAD family hydrolase [Betaproteobacteria bacterium]
MIEAVLFDLDGTLADTAPDLGAALNRLLIEKGRPIVTLDRARRLASSGARGLIQTGFGITPEHPDYAALQVRFLDLYETAVCVDTRLFPGMAELLDQIESRAMVWGIVTNKASRFTLPLVAALGVEKRAACVVSGDATPRLKPAPDSLLYAAQMIGIVAQNCLYVGDDLRDIQAARAAGMPVLAATYGYLGDGEQPDKWGADALISSPMDILKFLG